MNVQTIFSIVERVLILPSLIYVSLTLKITEIPQMFIHFSSIVTTKPWLFLSIVCLILLVFAFVLADPVIYAMSLGFFIITSNYISISWILIIIFTSLFLLMLILNTIKTGWRNDQSKSLSIINIHRSHIIVFMIILLVFFVFIPYLSTELASMAILLFLKVPQPKDAALVPLWMFMTNNIVGESIIVSVVLAVVYGLIQKISSIISMYMVPSKSAVIEDAKEWLSKETWFTPALMYIGSFAESIIITPLLYSTVMILIERVSMMLGILIMNTFILNIVNFVIALLMFFIVWRFVSKIISFEPLRPSLRSVIFVGTIVILIYLAIYSRYSVIINPFDPSFTAFDSYIYDTYISFYNTLFLIVQWILILIGVVP
ncbi:MAG: hypothetical protein QW128_09040 [Thermoprotei archaeon]